MTPLVRNGVILAGVLVLGGAATAIIVTSQTTKQAPEAIAPAVAPPSSAQASSPPEAAPLPQAAPGAATSPAQPVAAPATPVLAFDPLVQRFSLLRDSAAYVAASTAAPQMYPLKSGTPLVSAAKSRDGAWIIATTEDGQAAYLPAADLGPYDPSRAHPHRMYQLTCPVPQPSWTPERSWLQAIRSRLMALLARLASILMNSRE